MSLNALLIQQPGTRTAQYLALATLVAVAVPLLMQLPLPIVVLFGLLCGLRVLLTYLGVGALSNWVLIPAMLACAALVYAQLNTLIGREGGISFLLLLALLKSFEGKSTRDWQVLLLASLFLVVGALLFEQGLLTGLWVLLCLWAVLFSLSLLNLMPVRSAARYAGLGLCLSAPLMAVLFVAVPRLPEPLWRIPQQQKTQAQSGLSETLKPGAISELIQSNELAFNAHFLGGQQPRMQDLYWRVMVMAEFNGGQWQAVDKNYVDQVLPAAGSQRAEGRYQLTLRDQDGRLPALDYPTQVDDTTEYRLGATVRVKRSYEQLRRITLHTNFADRLPETMNNGQQAFYLRLPDGNPRTRQLAQNLKAGAGSSQVLVQRALDYYARNGFVYTLKPPLLTDADQTDEFLFGTKQGFCEHYASSMAVLLRAAGLPSRVVTGYQGGDYYAEGDFWQVRSKDAHAWVEVWLPESQAWQRVDPTAMVSAHRIAQGIDDALPQQERAGWSERAPWQRWFDRSQFYWQQWVVGFDAEKQGDLFRRLGLSRVNFGSVLLVLLSGSLMAVLPWLWWWRRSLRRNTEPLADGFMQLKAALLGADHEALLATGPLQLKTILQAQNEWNQPLASLLDQYIALRYQSPVDMNHPDAWRWYRRMRQVLKKNNKIL